MDVLAGAWALAVVAVVAIGVVTPEPPPGLRVRLDLILAGLVGLPLVAAGSMVLADRWFGRPAGDQAVDYDDQVAAEPGAAADRAGIGRSRGA
jgi:hypothetical protein